MLRIALWVLAGFAVLFGASWLAVPAIVKSQLQSRGSELLGRPVTVQRVEFAPFELALTLHALAVGAAPGAAAGAPAPLEVARVHVDADLRSLLRLAPVLEAVELDSPRLRVAHVAPGRFDFDDVVERLAMRDAPPPPDAEPARFALFNLKLEDGEIVFDDRPVQRRHEVKALRLAVPFLSNLPDDVQVRVEPRLAFTFDAAAVDLQGRALPFAPDRATEMTLKLDRLALDRLWAYLPATVPVRPTGGTLAAELALTFSQPQGATPRVKLAGRTGLTALGVKTRQGLPLVSIGRLDVPIVDLRPLERHVALGAVALEGAQVHLRRDAQGAVEVAALGGASIGAPPASAAASASASGAGPAVAASAASASSAPPAGRADAAAPWQVQVEKVALAGARVHWSDATTRPQAEFSVEDLALTVERVRLPAADDWPLQLAARVLAAGKPAATLRAKGPVTPQRASVAVEIDDVQLAAAAPYLRAVLVPAVEGRAKAAAQVDWAAGDAPQLALKAGTLQVDALKIIDPAARARPWRVASIAVDDLAVDVVARQVEVGALRVRRPLLALERDAKGVLDVARWVPAAADATDAGNAPPDRKPSAAPARAAAASAPAGWRVALADARVEGAQLAWADEAARAGQKVALRLAGLSASAQGVQWPPARNSPLRYQIATQIVVPASDGPAPQPGRLESRGRLAPEPLALRGSLKAERLPVYAFEPYFGDRLPVVLKRAELGAQLEIDLRTGARGFDDLKLDASGDVLIADLQVNARAGEGGDELLTWDALTLEPLRVAVAPGAKPRIEIDEVQLSDFYSRLVITEQGRFNLRDVQGAAPGAAQAASAPVAGAASAPEASAIAASAASAAAGAPAVAASASGGGLPVDLVVGRTRLVNGKVDFTDRFIRPNYSAALSELNGTLGRVATGTREMATLELKGRAAGTALLEIRGALNPTADPLALDITARATDLELAPFSPYSGKYAGYAIERGKLSMDVAYRIDPDGKLDAKNQIILNQLTFGDKVDSPDATKLPVRLAVALLTDRNGVIDIDLPISGSINDPQFSVFGLVLKIIGNLLVKALTAPFALLAGGGGEDLSFVEFRPGTAQFSAAGAGAIDKVAKALTDRPALRMTVTGAADPASEREAIQSAALEARVLAEQRRELARAGTVSAPDAPLPALSAEERTRLVKRIYADAPLPDKPRNLIGMQKDLPLPEMEAMLKKATQVSTDSARELALKRGLAVRDALVARGLPSERLFLGAPKLRTSGEDDAAWTPRVQLVLEAR
jgi:hypothetical protein